MNKLENAKHKYKNSMIVFGCLDEYICYFSVAKYFFTLLGCPAKLFVLPSTLKC